MYRPVERRRLTACQEVLDAPLTLNEWDYSYDLRNRKTDEYQPAVQDYDHANASIQPHLTWEYDGVGNVTASNNALGFRTVTLYDSANRPYQVTAPIVTAILSDGTLANLQPVVTQMSYDENGNVLTVTDPNGHQTGNTYDALDHLETTTPDASPDAPNKFRSYMATMPQATVSAFRTPTGMSPSSIMMVSTVT